MAKRCKKYKIEEESLFSRLTRKIGDIFYSLSVKIYQKRVSKFGEKPALKSKAVKSEIIFLCVMVSYPIICWLVNYVAVVMESFGLAFQYWDRATETYKFLGFGNIAKAFSDLFTAPNFSVYLKNSSILWCISTFVNMPLSVLIAFCIYKKVPFAGFFKVVLFLPQIIPGMVWVLVFKYQVDYVWPIFFGEQNFLINPKYDFLTLVLFQQWLSFAGGLIIYTGAMGRIPPELVEVGTLEGFTVGEELRYLTIPMIFNTIAVPLTTCLTGILTASLPLYMFYGEYAREGLHTLSYYLFTIVIGNNSSKELYPYSAAFSIVISAISIPFVLLMRKVLEMVSPNTEY